MTFLLWNGFSVDQKNFWELFSGGGNLSKAFLDSEEWNVLRPMDIAFGQAHNLMEGGPHRMR